MATVRVPVEIIKQEPLIQLKLIDTRRDDGKYYLTVDQARNLRIDLKAALDKLDGLA